MSPISRTTIAEEIDAIQTPGTLPLLRALIRAVEYICDGLGLLLFWLLSMITAILYLVYYGSKMLWIQVAETLGRRRIIADRKDCKPYLERYYLFMRDRSPTFPFNIFIHKFLESDPDDLHDHPWGYYTLILWGGYWEHFMREDKPVRVWRGPGYFGARKPTWRHRLELDKGMPCWTLFIPHQRVRQWGFWKAAEQTWVAADDYLADMKEN